MIENLKKRAYASKRDVLELATLRYSVGCKQFYPVTDGAVLVLFIRRIADRSHSDHSAVQKALTELNVN